MDEQFGFFREVISRSHEVGGSAPPPFQGDRPQSTPTSRSWPRHTDPEAVTQAGNGNRRRLLGRHRLRDAHPLRRWCRSPADEDASIGRTLGFRAPLETSTPSTSSSRLTRWAPNIISADIGDHIVVTNVGGNAKW